jgi:hypothetical protein
MIKKLLYVSSIFLSLLLLLLHHPVLSESEEIYKWVDEKGTLHITDSLSQVPPKYRNQFEMKASQEGVKSAAPPNSQKKNTSDPAEPPAVTLKRFEVPYKAFEGRARRIIIPVTFNGSITVPMLLDTGATDIYISLNLADRLGLFKKQHGKLIVQARGIGGSVPAILTIIDRVSVRGAKAKCVPARINITHVLSGAFEGLVGMDFMGNYNISIDTRKHVVTFEELPSQSDMPGGHDETWWRYNFRTFSSLRAAWKNYLNKLKKVSVKTSETRRLTKIANHQYNEANKLYRKLERYATWNSVPTHWRR